MPSPQKPKAILEKLEHGWLLLPPQGQDGVTISALNEVVSDLPQGLLMLPGIANHYKNSGKNVVVAFATKEGAEKWEAVINDSISTLEPHARWWRGCDFGLSAAAIFAVFAPEPLAGSAYLRANGATPRDAADFGRCKRLLEKFPSWKGRLAEVATAYPETKWPAIIARWDELAGASAERVYEILSKI